MDSQNIIRAVICLCCLIVMSGCVRSRQMTGPAGEVMHSIDCSGTWMNMGMCLEKAGKICGSYGYDILMGDTRGHGNAANFGQYGYFSTPIVTRELVIRCKGGPGAKPELPKASEGKDTAGQNL